MFVGPQQQQAMGFGGFGGGQGMSQMGFGGQGQGMNQMGFGGGSDPTSINSQMMALGQQNQDQGNMYVQMHNMMGMVMQMMMMKQMMSSMANFGGGGGGGGGGTPGISDFLGGGSGGSGGGGGTSSVGGGSSAPSVDPGQLGEGTEMGKALAKYAGENANGPGGYCYKWVAQALAKQGVNVHGASAYMAADQLAKSDKFTEVKVEQKDLAKLPAGAVVVWDKGAGHEHGHISIALGNGKEASDKLRTQITNYGTTARVFLPK